MRKGLSKKATDEGQERSMLFWNNSGSGQQAVKKNNMSKRLGICAIWDRLQEEV